MRERLIGLLILLGSVMLGGCSLAPHPVAVATAAPSLGYAPLEVAFDASASSTPSDRIASYTWDFGDGQAASDPMVDHTFTAKGTHLVVLEIVDSDGSTAQDELTIRVLNRVPHAEFHVSPYGAPRDHPVTFDASSSYDLDGTIVEYGWDSGDGSSATGARVEHIFPQRLEYHVTLTVRDDDGTENSAARTVVVAGCDTCG